MNPKDMVIYSDMDGTLLSSWNLGPIIVDKNIKMIKRWEELGGSFSIATGRNLKNVLHFLEGFRISYPLVLVNGAMLYSYQSKEIMYKELIPKSFLTEAINYYKNNKRVALVISNEDEVFSITHKCSEVPELDFPTIEITLEELNNINVLKVTFVVFETDSDKIIDDINKFNNINEVNVVPSSKRFIEFVSVKASKAIGIMKALQDSKKKIVCIGDYLNDMEMLKIADISACPENGHEDVKKSAHIITVNNNEGAIGDLINKLLTS